MLEKLIEVLAALVAALNNNTAALKGAASTKTPTKEKDKPADTGAAAPTDADVRNVCNAYLEAQKDKPAREAWVAALNQKYGSERLTKAPKEKFGEIIAAVNAEIARLKAAPSDDSGI